MPDAEKVRENRLRRKLDRMGFRLMRSRARDPDDITFGGYQITDIDVRGVVAGYGNANRGFAFDLEDVEEWIAEQRRGDGEEEGADV